MLKLNIKAVARQTGLSCDTIRAWEKRYQAVTPARSDTGRREYRPIDVQRLCMLASLVRIGHSISNIANLSNEELLAQAKPILGIERQDDVAKICLLIKAFDLANLDTRLRKILFDMSPKEFAFYFVSNIMTLTANLTETGDLSLFQEHAVSEIFGRHLRRIYEDLSSMNTTRSKQETVILALPEGEYHEFGLLIAGIVCRINGLNTVYLGPNLPMDSLAQTANRLQPKAIVLSASQIPPEFIKCSIKSYVKNLLSRIPQFCAIWIGGTRAFEAQLPRYQKQLRVFESMAEFAQKIENL